MAKLDFYFDTQKVNEDITNWRDLEIEVSFEDEDGVGAIKSGSLEFTGALAEKINKWNAQGMTGGPGIFEAPPFRIEVCGSGDIVFNGGIDTAACPTLYECDKVIAPLRSDKINFLNDRANSFRFGYLASLPVGAPGRITQADYVSVPYVINSIPDFLNIMVAGMSLYMMLKELHEIIEKTVAVANELSGDTAMALGSVVNPIIATAMAIGRILVDIIRIILYILYLVFIIRTVIELVIMIFDNLIQPVKYKKGMRVLDLFTRGATFLGLTLSSTLLAQSHQNDVIIPRKTALTTNTSVIQNLFGLQNLSRKDYDDANNPASTGFFEGTFADLILIEEQRLNAEVRVIGGTLHFETKDFFARFANYTLPNIQRRNADPHGTNACELAANYILSYSVDPQDTNTSDQYEGTSCEMTLAPIAIQNTKNVLLKNLTEITLQYALAKRKNNLNAVEEVVSAIYNIVASIYNAVTGFLNSILSVINGILSAISALTGGSPPQIPLIASFPPNPIQARIGMMLLSSDFIGIPKVLVVDSSNKVHSNNHVLTAAQTLIDDLHFTNFAVRTITSTGVVKNDHNQWLTYTDKEIPFCCGDYQAVLNNNFIKTYDQKIAKVKSLVWRPFAGKDRDGEARITYRVKEQYTKNLKQSYVIDGKP